MSVLRALYWQHCGPTHCHSQYQGHTSIHYNTAVLQRITVVQYYSITAVLQYNQVSIRLYCSATVILFVLNTRQPVNNKQHINLNEILTLLKNTILMLLYRYLPKVCVRYEVSNVKGEREAKKGGLVYLMVFSAFKPTNRHTESTLHQDFKYSERQRAKGVAVIQTKEQTINKQKVLLHNPYRKHRHTMFHRWNGNGTLYFCLGHVHVVRVCVCVSEWRAWNLVDTGLACISPPDDLIPSSGHLQNMADLFCGIILMTYQSPSLWRCKQDGE